MAITREQGIKQIEIQIQIENEGVDVAPSLFKDLDYENVFLEQIRACFDYNFKNYVATKIPASFRIKSSGFLITLFWNPSSPVKIVRQNEKFYLIKDDGKDFAEEIEFEHKPAFYNKRTSDGKDMSRIVQASSKGRLAITYSNECALKDKGLDCLFCNINATKSRFAELDKLEWKNPAQIGETVAEAYREGFHGFNLTGGFVPERREVEYYIDIIESVKDNCVAEEEIHGMACVGAPQDLSIIENYREAGYQHIATNMEIWDENLFRYICPGKEQFCGGRENWLNTLKHEVEVFGKGNVRSHFVGGLEIKESLLEGIEHLASIGVMADATIWKPNIGSALEGHRAPETAWQIDVAKKVYQILKKHGFTYEQYYYVTGENRVTSHFYQLDGEHLPWEKPLEVIASA